MRGRRGLVRKKSTPLPAPILGATTATFSMTMFASVAMATASATSWQGWNDPQVVITTVDPTEVLVDENGGPLPCYGCAHSAAGERYPSKPSGERPCGFCRRNMQALKQRDDDYVPSWYDGSKPLRLDRHKLQDNYVSTDRLSEDIERSTPIDPKEQTKEERMVSLWRKAQR